jgi:hypothetical protein
VYLTLNNFAYQHFSGLTAVTGMAKSHTGTERFVTDVATQRMLQLPVAKSRYKADR